MFEYLALNLLWWHWIVFGLILLAVEVILLPLFIVIWFGLAAIVVGIISLLFLTSFNANLLLWIIFSILFLAAWFMFFKDKTESKSGQSDFGLDSIGIVVEPIKELETGKVKFEQPILGSTLWSAISDEEIKVGEKVAIVDVNGQLLKVKKEN